MTHTLDVYLHADLAGKLVQDDEGNMRFRYAPEWLGRPDVMPLSHSLPLQEKRFSRNQSRAFFAGILPEQHQREVVAENLGISSRNDFAMLDRIGGECAGAVTFCREGTLLPERQDVYRQLSERDLAELLRTLPRRPLLAGEEGIRLSLAGAQDKIAVRVTADAISVPLIGAPSTHILKPAIERFEGIVFNEAFCMGLAKAVGLNVASVEIRNAAGIDFLLVERYDRQIHRDQTSGSYDLVRVHQEDFCQALGIVPERKYEVEGGPSLKQCFDLLREVSSSPVLDLNALLDAAIFNFLIGNRDAHGKNFSLLYQNGKTRLAPLYDLVSTACYPELSTRMAMKIGGKSHSEEIGLQEFERMATDAGLAKPIVRRRVAELSELTRIKLRDLAPDHAAEAKVAAIADHACEELLRS